MNICSRLRQMRSIGTALLLAFVLVAGCHRIAATGGKILLPPPPIEIPVSNPAHIEAVDPDFLWSQIADAVDDYFRIQSEQPVRRDQMQILEGKLTTYPEVSGTIFEPWRNDAARGYERIQSTFQTIRRTAIISVLPEETGYVIDIQVIKEKEDRDRTQFAAPGVATQRHDGGIVRSENEVQQLPVTLGWYQIGRDRELEQRLMADILGRVNHVLPPKKKLLH